MMRLLALAILPILAGTAPAQYTGWGNGGLINPWGGNAGGPFAPPSIGTLPNGTNVIDPWTRPSISGMTPSLQMRFANQFAAQYAAPVLNPSLAMFNNLGNSGGFNAGGFNAGGFANGGYANGGGSNMGFGGFNSRGNRAYQRAFNNGQTQASSRQFEPGSFYPVGQDAALNPTSGTVLRPYSGVAFTNEGAFYRLPGTGSYTPYGTYLPGSGIYMNPFTGVGYNPQTGVIQRP